ncbi:MAG: hypothetical protein AAFQ13_10155 [Pseudomonadota bacterium]
MNRLLLLAAGALTIIIFLIGYALQFIVTFIAVLFDLPGPYADHPAAWVWFALNLGIVFAVAYLFCRWLAHKVEARVRITSEFE